MNLRKRHNARCKKRFLLWCFEKWNLGSETLSDGTLLGSFLLEQCIVEQTLKHDEVMAVKRHSALDAQMVIVCTHSSPLLSAGREGGGVEPLTKFSKMRGLTVPQYLEGIAGKEGMTFSGGLQFLHKK